MSSREIFLLFGSVWDSHISHSGMIPYHNLVIIINQDGFFTANSCYHGGLVFHGPGKLVFHGPGKSSKICHVHGKEMALKGPQSGNVLAQWFPVGTYLYIYILYECHTKIYIVYTYVATISKSCPSYVGTGANITTTTRRFTSDYTSVQRKLIHQTPRPVAMNHWICMNHWWI